MVTESEQLAKAIAEREMARPAVEEAQARQLETKGYISPEQEEAIRKKVEAREDIKRGIVGKTFRGTEKVAGFIEAQLAKITGKDRGTYTRAEVKRLVRKAPKARLSRKKAPKRAKRPTKANLQKMAKLRAMRGVERRAPVRARRATQVRLPTSVRELQNYPNLRSLLPQYERQRIDSMPRAFRKEASMNYLRPKLRQQQIVMNRQRKEVMRRAPAYEQRVEVDLLTGRPKVVNKNIRREAWTL